MKKNRLLASLLLFSFITFKPSNAEAASTSNNYYPVDIGGHWAEDSLKKFVAADILNGYDNGDGSISIKPDSQIKRDEFVAILVRAFHLKQKNDAKIFDDVKSGDWFYDSVNIASSNGIIDGTSPSSFAPEKLIKRDEMATILIRVLGSVAASNTSTTFTDVPSTHWAYSFVTEASKIGIVDGYSDNNFKPENNAKRAEAIVMIDRATQKQINTLPTDTELQNLVANFELQSLSDIEKNDFSALQNDIESYTTGKYKESFSEGLSAYQDLKKQGFNVSLKVKRSTPQAKVIEKSNQYAVVKLTGITYSFTSSYDETKTVDANDDGLFYLQKQDDGTWKIFNNITQ